MAFELAAEVAQKGAEVVPGVNVGLNWLGAKLRGKLRGLGLEKVLLFYFPVKDGIEMVRVVHGKRDLERLLRKDSSDDAIESSSRAAGAGIGEELGAGVD